MVRRGRLAVGAAMLKATGMFPLALFALLAAVSPALAEGVSWQDLTLDEALAKAKEQDTIVLIDVYAAHCGQCKEMDEGLWEQAEGADLAEGLIALRVSTDNPEGHAVQRRYPVLGLPLVLFLEPDGREIDRIVGYNDHDAFLEEARTIRNGIDLLPEMEAELETRPLPHLMTEVLKKYLYRKREAEAEALLDKIISADTQGRSATMALSYTAKYYDYFRRDKLKAQSYHVRLLKTYPGSIGVTGAIRSTLDFARSQGALDQWIEFVCSLTDENPTASRLNYYVAKFSHDYGLRGECLGRAARNAKASGMPGADKMDSIAVILEGGS